LTNWKNNSKYNAQKRVLASPRSGGKLPEPANRQTWSVGKRTENAILRPQLRAKN
jgi:hypothetical protein